MYKGTMGRKLLDLPVCNFSLVEPGTSGVQNHGMKMTGARRVNI